MNFIEILKTTVALSHKTIYSLGIASSIGYIILSIKPNYLPVGTKLEVTEVKFYLCVAVIVSISFFIVNKFHLVNGFVSKLYSKRRIKVKMIAKFSELSNDEHCLILMYLHGKKKTLTIDISSGVVKDLIHYGIIFIHDSDSLLASLYRPVKTVLSRGAINYIDSNKTLFSVTTKERDDIIKVSSEIDEKIR